MIIQVLQIFLFPTLRSFVRAVEEKTLLGRKLTLWKYYKWPPNDHEQEFVHISGGSLIVSEIDL